VSAFAHMILFYQQTTGSHSMAEITQANISNRMMQI